MVGIVGNKWWFDGAAEELNVLPIEATPAPPAGNNLVIWNVMEDLFNVIILD